MRSWQSLQKPCYASKGGKQPTPTTARHPIRYAGTVEDVATIFVDRELSGQHPGAFDAGLVASHHLFCDDENPQGHMKVGPVQYAEFHFTGNEEAKVRHLRDASGLVQNLLDLIRDGLEKRRRADQ